MSGLTEIERVKMCEGWLVTYEHESNSNQCVMRFSVFLPPQAEHGKVPGLYFLSGLTCTDENFMVKAGAQSHAAEHGIALIAPDTSPRGDEVPDDPDAYDYGKGAGFYVNATEDPWATHYQMYNYVVNELPALIESELPIDARRSVTGHSMGGHGALIVALKNPGHYRSVSAFAPICAPTQCPWGEKIFSGYLGGIEAGREYDAVQLIGSAEEKLTLLIDQGDDDEFLVEQLKPQLLEAACQQNDHPLDLRMRSGYDHSYFFIQTFIGDHIAHHAAALHSE
ncbi:MAG: S-formylglutathione hydrolase [Pseudomonadota bacterium]